MITYYRFELKYFEKLSLEIKNRTELFFVFEFKLLWNTETYDESQLVFRFFRFIVVR